MHRRLRKLEGMAGLNTGDKITLILREIFEPSESGAKSCGIGVVSIVGGLTRRRHDFDSDTAFKAALDADHLKHHGRPIKWAGDEAFFTKGSANVTG